MMHSPKVNRSLRLEVSYKHEVGMYYWLAFVLVLIFFAPPIPLGFTATKSTLSPALFAICLFLGWRIIQFKFIDYRSLYGGISHLFTLYLGLHAVFYLLIGKKEVLLLEMQWVFYFAGFISLLRSIMSVEDLKPKLMKLILWVAIFQAILGLYTSLKGPIYDYNVAGIGGRFGFDVFRAVGTFSSANGFGGFIAFAAILSIFSSKSCLPMPRIFLCMIFIPTLILSQSKSAMCAFVIGLCVAVFCDFLKSGSIKKMLGLYALVSGIGSALYLFKDVLLVINEDYSDLLNYTGEVWNQYWSSDLLHMVIGFGFRQTAIVNPETQGWLTAHNSYVSFLAEIGWIGFGCLLIIWGYSFIRLLHQRDSALLGALVVLLCHLYTEGFLYGNSYIFLMCFIFVNAAYKGFRLNGRKGTVE